MTQARSPHLAADTVAPAPGDGVTAGLVEEWLSEFATTGDAALRERIVLAHLRVMLLLP